MGKHSKSMPRSSTLLVSQGMTHPLFQQKPAVFLAYDQGFEHGPKDFTWTTADPGFILRLANHPVFNAIITLPGVAEQYGMLTHKPLIIKVNSKTSLQHEPRSIQHTPLSRAISLRASAIGYTLYPGSPWEEEQYAEAGMLIHAAREKGLPVMLWSYPRGHGIDEYNTDTIAYAARIAAELGADAVKLKYNHDPEGYRWVLRNALKSRVFISGGFKEDIHDFLRTIAQLLELGVYGFAIGRNVWQDACPEAVADALYALLREGKPVEEALRAYEEKARACPEPNR